MAEYIERGAAIQEINDSFVLSDDEKTVAIFRLTRVPAADVVERKRGRWELLDGAYSLCTNCRYERNAATQYGWNFCPNCGADMREVDHA